MIENAFKVGDYVRFKTVEEFKAGGRIPDSSSREIHSYSLYRSVPLAMQKHLCGETFHISEVMHDSVIAPYYHTEERLEFRRSGGGGYFWFIDDGMLTLVEETEDSSVGEVSIDQWSHMLS